MEKVYINRKLFQFTRTICKFFCVLLVALVLGGCETKNGLLISTTMFPQYDIAKNIVGSLAEVKMLLTPGADSHSFDPGIKTIVEAKKSDLFISTGTLFEPWTTGIVSSLSKSVRILDLYAEISKNPEFRPAEFEHNHSHTSELFANKTHDELNEFSIDPHIFTSPKYLIMMVDIVLEGVIEIAPEYRDVFEKNATLYKTQLGIIDVNLEYVAERIKNAGIKKIYFAAPFAFMYMFDCYFTPLGIGFEAAYETCSIEISPSVLTIIEMNREISEDGVKVVFLKELVLNNKVAKKIIEGTAATLATLHSGHNVSRNDFGYVTLIDLWEQNIMALSLLLM